MDNISRRGAAREKIPSDLFSLLITGDESDKNVYQTKINCYMACLGPTRTIFFLF